MFSWRSFTLSLDYEVSLASHGFSDEFSHLHCAHILSLKGDPSALISELKVITFFDIKFEVLSMTQHVDIKLLLANGLHVNFCVIIIKELYHRVIFVLTRGEFRCHVLHFEIFLIFIINLIARLTLRYFLTLTRTIYCDDFLHRGHVFKIFINEGHAIMIDSRIINQLLAHMPTVGDELHSFNSLTLASVNLMFDLSVWLVDLDL